MAEKILHEEHLNYLPHEMIGKPFSDIILCDDIYNSPNEVWLYVGNIQYLMMHDECYNLRCHVSGKVRGAFIKEIIINNNDIDIIIENPFKGVD